MKASQIEEIRANKQPIGSFDFAKKFTNHEIRIVEGDIIYLYSDGCVDQFGGPKGKKFKYKTLKILLTEHMDKSLEEQNNLLDQVFQEWKGDLEQLADVCVIGIRV
jgi:serine phosphatase RsbU (regulator of sigma subunit)